MTIYVAFDEAIICAWPPSFADMGSRRQGKGSADGAQGQRDGQLALSELLANIFDAADEAHEGLITHKEARCVHGHADR